jgi:hypothetical protein
MIKTTISFQICPWSIFSLKKIPAISGINNKIICLKWRSAAAETQFIFTRPVPSATRRRTIPIILPEKGM